LVQTFEGDAKPCILAVHMIDKLQFITRMHGEVKEDVCQIQVHQKCAYASKKGK